MIKQRNNKSVYKIEIEGCIYLVTIFNLKNDVDGNPRFEANIIDMGYFEGGANYCISRVYRFKGNYWRESGEAKFIAQYHHDNIIKK